MHNNRSIRSLIISGAQNGARNIVDLIDEISLIRPGTTKQAVYAAIRKLKEEEVVTVHHKYISLSKLWIHEQLSFFQSADEYYNHDGAKHGNILSLKDGDKVTYTFNDLASTDQYWGHIFQVLSKATPKSIPIFIYNPHEWFLIAREESEKKLFNDLDKNHKLLLLTCASNSNLDKAMLKSNFREWNHQYQINTTLKFPNNYYLNIFDSYIIEVKLNNQISNKIDAWYVENDQVNMQSNKELLDVISQKGKNTLSISHNSKKAHALRKRLIKGFYIPKEYSI